MFVPVDIDVSFGQHAKGIVRPDDRRGSARGYGRREALEAFGAEIAEAGEVVVADEEVIVVPRRALDLRRGRVADRGPHRDICGIRRLKVTGRRLGWSGGLENWRGT